MKAPPSIQPRTVLQVIHGRHWIPLILLAGLAILAIAYMIFGRIPVTVEGNAMFMTPGTVTPFQATASGQIGTWRVHVGDRVTKGQLLAELQQPLIQKQLEQAREKLVDLQSRNETMKAQSDVHLKLEREGIARKKVTLQARIESLKAQNQRSRQAMRKVHQRKQAYMAQREKDLKEMRRLNEKRQQEMADKVVLTAKLKDQGLRSEDQLLQVKRRQIAQDQQTSGTDLQLVQAALDSARAAEVLLDSGNRIAETEQQIADLEHELNTLQSREWQLSEQAEAAHYARRMEISEVERSIARFAKQLTEEREVRAEHDGQVIELTSGEGERVAKGVVLGSIDTRTSSSTLGAVAYFKLKDGKKIEPGMTIRLTPAIAQQDRFGGIIGTVKSVSEYPVTAAGVARTIGNSQASEMLTKDGHFIEVYATLRTDDTYSGFAWEHFGGPDMLVTAGTIAAARVNTEEVRPAAFVLPIMEGL